MTLMSYGKPACICLAEWLPYYERELKARGILPAGSTLTVYQLIGGAVASGGTHATGGAFDVADLPGDEELWVARQMGSAAWSRRTNWDGNNGIAHIHGVLRGCPHNGPARYQIAALDAGYNGLGAGGRGGPDDGPKPFPTWTWRDGVSWHHEQAKARKRAVYRVKIVDTLTQRKAAKAVVARLTARVRRLRKERDGL